MKLKISMPLFMWIIGFVLAIYYNVYIGITIIFLAYLIAMIYIFYTFSNYVKKNKNVSNFKN
jgi:hypothetical protein